MAGRFDGKNALVTGGGSGIGAAVVRRLVHDGARVAILDLDEASALALSNELGDATTAKVVDVARPDVVAQVVDEVVSEFGSLDLAVNNAGISSRNVTIIDLEVPEWDRIIDVNQNGIFFASSTR